jgi:hypothetical protein
MNNEFTDYVMKLTLFWIVFSALMTIPASCAKFAHSFYTQVIVKHD